MDVTNPCEFIGFGALDVTKTQGIYKLLGVGEVRKPVRPQGYIALTP